MHDLRRDAGFIAPVVLVCLFSTRLSNGFSGCIGDLVIPSRRGSMNTTVSSHRSEIRVCPCACHAASSSAAAAPALTARRAQAKFSRLRASKRCSAVARWGRSAQQMCLYAREVSDTATILPPEESQGLYLGMERVGILPSSSSPALLQVRFSRRTRCGEGRSRPKS